MTIPAKSVRFDDKTMWVALSGDRVPGVPLAWFPRLLKAAPIQLQACAITARGLHWDEFDEDISIAGLLAGRGAATHQTSTAA